MADENRKRLDESFSGKEFQKGLTGSSGSEIDWDNIQVTPSGNIEVPDDSSSQTSGETSNTED